MYNEDPWLIFLALMGVIFLMKLIWTSLSIVLSAFLFKIPNLLKKRTSDTSDSSTSGFRSDGSPSSSSCSDVVDLSGYDYEVFLSFRGPDTRKGITNHLCTNLKEAGIHVFLDDEELRAGEEIGGNILEAINQSKIFIPIFSKGYASSKWCLREVAHVVKCMDDRKQYVLPIFYDVTPDNVKHQSGTYQKAFKEHSKHHRDGEEVQEWRDSLRKIGKIKGFELKKIADGHEAEFVSKVVSTVRKELQVAQLILKDTIVGVEDSVEEVMDLLNVGASDVRVVGIYGIGGIGKTTLAKVIYNRILQQFERTSFLVDVRETSLQHNGIQKLQTQLISDILRHKQEEFSSIQKGIKELSQRCRNKKVLIVLDDVDEGKQLDNLVGDIGWFAKGSRIILTTRNKDLLESSQFVTKSFEVPEMQLIHARVLFCKHAFGRDSPLPGFEHLTDEIISTTGRLPLALQVIGSLPLGEDKEKWEATHKKLQEIPVKDVQKKLKISYEALEDQEKHIFLDIACFFIGTDWRIPSHLWEERKFHPGAAIRVLCAMSLIKVNQCGELWMHDQLRVLGRKIVLNENYSDPGRRSRLWLSEEAMDVIKLQQGTEAIEAIHLGYGAISQDYGFTREQFMKLSKLRFLRLNKANFVGNFDNLLPMLNWLHWHNCPAILKATNFRWNKLLILDLSESKVTDDWDGWRSMQTAAGLKVLILRSCCELTKTPDFSNLLKLERLCLNYCTHLESIGPSIKNLRNLKSLSVKYCSKLKELPQVLCSLEALTALCIDRTDVKEIPPLEGLKKLEMLSAKECKSLTNIKSIRHLTSLVELLLDSSGVYELPDSIGKLVNLKCLSLDRCRKLAKVPASIGRLLSLKELRLSETSVQALPDSIGQLKNLEVLNLSRSDLMYLPDALGMLEKLKVINIDSCRALGGKNFPDLEKLHHLRDLILANTNITMLPASIGKLLHLQTLDLTKCDKLQTLPELPCSLQCLSVTCKPIAMIPGISNLVNLEQLQLIRCDNLLKIPKEICKLAKLKKLSIIQMDVNELPEEVGMLSRLKELAIVNCEQLQSISKLPPKLYKIEVKGFSAEKFPNLSNSRNLAELKLSYCLKLENIPGLGSLKFLTVLMVSECGEIVQLDGLEELEYLRDLQISCCDSLEKLPDISKLKELRYWIVRRCRSLQSLPNLSGLKMLRNLDLSGCEKLHMLEGVDELELLETLDISECKEIENLPNLSKLRKLMVVNVRGCRKLTEIHGLEEPEVPVEIYCNGCTSLRNIPELLTESTSHGSVTFTPKKSDRCIWKL